MQSVHVKGPWAFYEHRHREQEEKICSLQQLNEEQKIQIEEGIRSSHEVEEKLKSTETKTSELVQQLESSEKQTSNLQHQLDGQSATFEKKVEELTNQLEEAMSEKEHLAAQNEVMKVEIKNHLSVKQSTEEKVKKLKTEIGLSDSESKHLIQEMEATKLQNEEQNKINRQLLSENVLLRDQCTQHSRHCLLLIKENKRLMDRIAEFKATILKEH